MTEDIRWKQRFENLEKAYFFLEKAVAMQVYDELQQAGLVQSFEFTFELSWKTMKDYLVAMGLSVVYPREVIKEAFKAGLLDDGHIWIQMLEKRNELTHTYNEMQARHAVEVIRTEYFPAIQQFFKSLKKVCENECMD